MKQPVVLLYEMHGKRAAKLRMVAMRFRIRVRPVARSEYALPIERLLDEPPAQDATGEPLPEEMLVMARFPAGLMQAFLQGIRKSGLRPVSLKAMLTPTNAAWDSRALALELSKEREAFAAGVAAHAQETET